jgi:NADPH-dependent curcumin reductase CurA
MGEIRTRILMKSYPQGMPTDSDFDVVVDNCPEPKGGEILCRTIYMSLDPYMRGRMNPSRKSYAAPVDLGQTPPAMAIGEVLLSRHTEFKKGDIVKGWSGWQSHWLDTGESLRTVKQHHAALPLSAELGVLGMPGLTAYAGLLALGEPREGETVFVSAATGAVGSVVGQIAKIKGCRAIGIASSEAKCEFAVKELGYDICLNHRQVDLRNSLKAAAPDGIDINFENVGGQVFWDVLARLNLHGRVIVCGAIANYNATGVEQGPDRTAELLTALIARRLQFKGLLVSDHFHLTKDFRRDMEKWIAEGRLKFREDIVQGIDKLIPAFQGLLEGKNFGKLVVKMAAEPQ